MSAEASVVVTGLGTVSAAGVARPALEAALRHGEPRSTPIDRSTGHHAPQAACTAALVGDLDLRPFIPPLEARRMSPASRYAVVAARTALDDAGLDVRDESDAGIVVVVASAFGPAAFSQRLLDQILDEGPTVASPSLFTECVANAPAARVALACRATGPNLTIVQGEAGPLRAVAHGAAEVAAGGCWLALVGATEELTPLLHAILDRFRALARPRGEAAERARPFDRRRDGVLAAEGATLLALEAEAAARRRGAGILARVRGGWSAFDASAPASGWGRGEERLAGELVKGLERHGLAPADVDRIVSGASGSRAGDRLEALVLRRAWGARRLPPILAPKATTGEYGGAFLGAAVLALAGTGWGPTAGFEETDPELEVRPHDGSPLEPARRVLVSGLAAGGAASWLILERP